MQNLNHSLKHDVTVREDFLAEPRIHSFRGARIIEITLDGEVIFHGEITRASGGITGSSDTFGEVS